MFLRSLFFIAIFCLAHSAFALEAVPNLDLKRYMGEWHEMARFPNKHQTDCVKTKAIYTLDDKDIGVKNLCSLANGKVKEVSGIAKIEDPKASAKLKVNFVPTWLRWLGIGWGNYWVIELDADYSYAVVSEPKQEYLWILSRTPAMKKALYDGIVERLQKMGFDTSKLIFSGQLD
jgi:apolipoprotein D and lipocalin family protein